jgi:uncharacterized protein YvpB
MKPLAKTIIIAVVFVASIFALIEIEGESLSDKRLHKTIFLETVDDWQKCRLFNSRLLKKENSIGFINLAEPSEVATYAIDPEFEFTQLILSWNATPPDSDSVIEFIVEVSPDSQVWHRFDYQRWGIANFHEHDFLPAKSIPGLGKIDVDYLVLEKPMHFARVIVLALGEPKSKEIYLRRLALSFSNDKANRDAFVAVHGTPERPDYGKIKLAVPYFTQRNLPSELAGNCCSPTSVSMVLNHHGIEIDPETMAHRVYDPDGRIFGNWPHNVAAAYAAGMERTWVEVHCSFDELYGEVADGKPVVISLAFDLGELPNSPIKNGTDGHLIVVVGFEGPHTVICNDPAGHDAGDGIIRYPRKELERVWQEHGGIAYHLWPTQ